jgi:hypothetical protein
VADGRLPIYIYIGNPTTAYIVVNLGKVMLLYPFLLVYIFKYYNVSYFVVYSSPLLYKYIYMKEIHQVVSEILILSKDFPLKHCIYVIN